MIYLDNAATTLKKPPQVAQAVLSALDTLGNSSRGTHDQALCAAHTLYDTRVKLAQLFGCRRADHVVFTGNVTEALNMALSGLVEPGDHVVSTDLEHNSVLRPLYRLEEQGAKVDFIPADKQGNLRMEALERLLRPDTKLVVCTHASNLTGNLAPVAQISQAAHARGALVVVDAAQTAGSRPVDMDALGADVLCFTGHKGLMGPQGVGGLCIREGVSIRPFQVGGTGVQTYRKTQPEQYPDRLEAGTRNGHGIAGLSAALDFINAVGIEAIRQRKAALTRRFYDGVREIPGITVYGDFTGERAAIVALNVRDRDSGQVSDLLAQEYGIATRPGAHCAPRLHQALGTQGQGAVRFSFSWFNTQDEIDAALTALQEIARDET